MEIKFKLQAAALNAALDVVSIVPPRPITPQGGTGYLFIIRKEEGKDHAYVYSRDTVHVTRAHFPIADVEGEGAFIYPAQHIEAFRFAEGEVAFTVSSDGDLHSVRYDLGAGAGAERPTFDPKLLTSCDKKFRETTAEHEFPVAILREALNMTKPFLVDAKDQRVEEHYKTIQIFDTSNEAWAKGDGTMFAANGTQAFYFHCDAFKGKGLQVHASHLPYFTAFLAKAEGKLKIKSGPDMTFAEDARGRVLGWSHHSAAHGKYSYYSLKKDNVVLAVPKTRTLNALKYTKTELEPKRDKIKVHFDHVANTLRFQVVEGGKAMSLPVDVRPKEGSEARSFTHNMNIDHMIELLNGSKAEEVEFRMSVLPADGGRPESATFRTIDEFWLDTEGKVVGGSNLPEDKQPEGAFRCRATRFVPAKL